MSNQKHKVLNIDVLIINQLLNIENDFTKISTAYGGKEECVKFYLEYENSDIEILDEKSRNKFWIGSSLSYIPELKNELNIDDIDWILNEIYELGMSYGFAAEFITGKDSRSILMRKCAKKRFEKDPIQIAKKEIEQHYESLKCQFKRRGYSAEFIRNMHKKYPVIIDKKTIERLVAKLNKNNEHIPPKLA